MAARAAAGCAGRTAVSFLPLPPSTLTTELLEQTGGSVRRAGQDATDPSERNAPYGFISAGAWNAPADSDTNVRWARENRAAMRPFRSTAAYLDYLTADEQVRV